MSLMSLFEGLDVASASDDPWSVSVGTHAMVVSGCKAGPTKKDAEKRGVLWTFDVTDGADKGNSFTDWQWIPKKDDESDEAIRARKFLKQRMVQLGVPNERINNVSPEDMIGIEGYMSIKESAKGNKYLEKITLTAPPEGTLSPSAPAEVNPFA